MRNLLCGFLLTAAFASTANANVHAQLAEAKRLMNQLTQKCSELSKEHKKLQTLLQNTKKEHANWKEKTHHYKDFTNADPHSNPVDPGMFLDEDHDEEVERKHDQLHFYKRGEFLTRD